MAHAGRPAVCVACCTMFSISSTCCRLEGTPFCTSRLFSSPMPGPRLVRNLHSNRGCSLRHPRVPGSCRPPQS